RHLQLVVARQLLADAVDGDRVAARRGGRHEERAALHAPGAAVGGEALHRAVVEVGAAQHVSRAAGVARLRIIRRAGLVSPPVVALVDEADLPERLAVSRRVGAGIGGTRTVGAGGARQV